MSRRKSPADCRLAEAVVVITNNILAHKSIVPPPEWWPLFVFASLQLLGDDVAESGPEPRVASAWPPVASQPAGPRRPNAGLAAVNFNGRREMRAHSDGIPPEPAAN